MSLGRCCVDCIMGLFWIRYRFLFLIGCYEAPQEAEVKFVPQNSPTVQFGKTPIKFPARFHNG